MAGLMYFVANASGTLTLDDLEELELRHAFDTQPFCREAMGDTPGGKNGLLLVDRKRLGNHAAKVAMSEQTWLKLPNLNTHVGWYTEAPPSPKDLLRRPELPGVSVPLADGQDWTIPHVRACDAAGECECRLPSRYDLDEAGMLKPSTVEAKYQRLWDVTQPFWDAMIAEANVDDQECLQCAGDLLAANYCISWREAGRLGLFSTAIGPAAIVALGIGYFTWQRWLEAKKKTGTTSQAAVTGSTTPDGEAA